MTEMLITVKTPPWIPIKANLSQQFMERLAENQRARIRMRTEQGRDVHDNPFKPYDEKRPYYSRRKFPGGVRTKVRVGKNKGKRGKTYRYASYGAFKRAGGRGVVDLFSFSRGKHMLNELVTKDVHVRGLGGGFAIGVYTPAKQKIAIAHMTGVSGRWRGNHKREFIGLSKGDIAYITKALAEEYEKLVRS